MKMLSCVIEKELIYKGRDNVDQFKSAHAANTKLRNSKRSNEKVQMFF